MTANADVSRERRLNIDNSKDAIRFLRLVIRYFSFIDKLMAHVPSGATLLDWDKHERAAAERRVLSRSGSRLNRASKRDCEVCPLKPRCCPNTPARKVPRSIHEGARDLARDIAKTEAYQISRCQRKKVEMLFAHLKRILKLDRLRLRGPNGARDEFHLAATAQNLRKLAKLIPAPALT